MSLPVLPIHIIGSINRRLSAATTLTTSVFSGQQQAQDWGGRWWEYKIELVTLTGAQARSVDALFNSLGGQAGRFVMVDPSARPHANVGAPKVAGANQTGGSLTTTGWGANGQLVARAGDIFSLGVDVDAHLYQLTEDVTTGAAGVNTTIKFVPNLRSAPADKAVLEFTNPKIVLRLKGDAPSTIETADHFKISFNAVEAL